LTCQQQQQQQQQHHNINGSLTPSQSTPAIPSSTSYAVPMPKFKINDIKLQSFQSNANLIVINSDLPLLNVQPALKSFIVPALDRAVTQMMNFLLEKTVKISIATAEPLIKKDFALDPDESHMRIAARNTIANMSSGMMLITGKEPLATVMYSTLKIEFTKPLEPQMANQFKELIAQACTIIVQVSLHYFY
jgi:CCR4-NOT transcription complex subunit 1